jgi:hypothetical protein
MLDVLIPLSIFCVTLLFYMHVKYHRTPATKPEILTASGSDDIEDVSRLRVPVVFREAIHCGNKGMSDILNAKESYDCLLLNSTTAMQATVDGTLSDLSLGRHSIVVDKYTCPVLADAGKPPMTLSSDLYGLYMQKGSRTPPSCSYNHRLCLVFSSGKGVCELFDPLSLKDVNITRNESGRFYFNNADPAPHSTKLSSGDVLVIPPFWGWKLIATADSAIEIAGYETAMSYVATLPERVVSDLRPGNSHNLSKTPAAKKRVRWKD